MITGADVNEAIFKARHVMYQIALQEHVGPQDCERGAAIFPGLLDGFRRDAEPSNYLARFIKRVCTLDAPLENRKVLTPVSDGDQETE